MLPRRDKMWLPACITHCRAQVGSQEASRPPSPPLRPDVRISPIRPLRRVSHGREPDLAGQPYCSPPDRMAIVCSLAGNASLFRTFSPGTALFHSMAGERLRLLCGLPLPSTVINGFNGTMSRLNSHTALPLISGVALMRRLLDSTRLKRVQDRMRPPMLHVRTVAPS